MKNNLNSVANAFPDTDDLDLADQEEMKGELNFKPDDEEPEADDTQEIAETNDHDDPQDVKMVNRAFSPQKKVATAQEKEKASRILFGNKSAKEAVAEIDKPRPGWMARFWFRLKQLSSLIAVILASAAIGLLAAIPLTPYVLTAVRHYGWIGFFQYHWTNWSYALGGYTDTYTFWYRLTAATVCVCVLVISWLPARPQP